jgi:hypothetical protein
MQYLNQNIQVLPISPYLRQRSKDTSVNQLKRGVDWLNKCCNLTRG